MIVLGTRKGLILLDEQGELLRECFAGQPVSYATRDPRTGTLWACLDHGHWGCKLHRSDTMGETWQEITAPTYPEGEVQTAEGKPAVLSYMWVIQPGPTSQPNRLYLGTEPGGLFISDDGGETFELARGLWDHPSRLKHWFGGGRDYPGLHSVIIDPRDPNHLFVGISCAGVFESMDGGLSWEPRNKGLYASFLPSPDTEVGHDPHLLLASPANPDVMWQQNHCGIFRSTNGAQSWQDISQPPAYFGFAIALDAQNPDAAWVVPAVSDQVRVAVNRALCVCYTEDGGQTWSTQRQGLPQHNCYDFAFRHALDIQGNTLVFGTANGSVFISDNRGQAWQSLGNHYPTIYSARFIKA